LPKLKPKLKLSRHNNLRISSEYNVYMQLLAVTILCYPSTWQEYTFVY